MIDLKHEMERELGLIASPDLWDRIEAGAATDDALDLTATSDSRRRSGWMAVAAAAIGVALVAAVALSEDGDSVDTSPADAPAVSDRLILPQHFEFAEAPASGGIGVPPGGGLTQPAGGGLGGSTLDLTVVGDDGQVTGEARIDGFVDVPGNPPSVLIVELECFETDTTDVIFGGRVTTSTRGAPNLGQWFALLIRSGTSATVWWDSGLTSCAELLEAVPYPRPDDRFVGVVEAP